MQLIKYIILLLSSLPLFIQAQENYKEINTKLEYTNTQPYEVAPLEQVCTKKTPKNIILLIGDGMGSAEIFAAATANKGQLNILNMIYTGMSKTQSKNNYITDSAAGGTALSTGKKTYNGAIGVIAIDGDTVSIPSLLEQAEQQGRATGLISTSSICHATPASFIAHQTNRSKNEAIAADFLNTDIDLFIGGGYSLFTHRKDSIDLSKQLEAKGYSIYRDLERAEQFTKGNIAILTADEHNAAYPERGDLLPQATEKAMAILSENSKKGFFLMVEGSMIDWGGHQNDISYIVKEMLDFDRAVGKALAFAAQDKNTLVIVTADHETGGLSIIGGNVTKGYIKGAFTSGHHTGIPVPVFAYGPGAHLFVGTYENTAIYDKIAQLWKIK